MRVPVENLMPACSRSARLLVLISLVLVISDAPHALAAGPAGPSGISAPSALDLSLDGTGFIAENPTQGFRSEWSAGGLRMTPLRGAGWSFRLELRGMVRRDASTLRPVSAASCAVLERHVEGNRLEWVRDGGIVEFHVHEHRGVEQGFRLERRPPGNGTLAIELSVSGLTPVLSAGGGAVRLLDDEGRDALRVGELHVFDATGRELTSWLETSQAGMTIAIDDATARWPLLVDPLISDPTWVHQGFATENSRSGDVVSSLGDVNGDGFHDVVGTTFHDGVGTRLAVLFLGSADGLASEPDWTYEEVDPAWVKTAAGAGDVDGDGFDDIVVAVGLDATGASRLLVFHGSPRGPADVPDQSLSPPAEVGTGARYGYGLAPAGDVNADGYDDVLVGASSLGTVVTRGGVAYLHHGSAAGLQETPQWVLHGDREDLRLGGSVTAAGDVNSDGFDDVLIGVEGYRASGFSFNRGRAVVVHGSAAGLEASPALVLEDPAATSFGRGVGGVGDVDGDGHADVAIGAPGHVVDGDDVGRIVIHRGSASGVESTPLLERVGEGQSFLLGNSVSSAIDIDDDGLGDVVAAASRYTDHGALAWSSASGEASGAHAPVGSTDWWRLAGAGDVDGDGHADLFVGAPAGFPAGALALHSSERTADVTPGTLLEPSASERAEIGAAVAAAGDVNGDGHADMIVGAPFHSGSLHGEGLVMVFHGGPDGFAATPDWSVSGGQWGALLGWSISTAGDVNADGYDDIVVGAPLHDGAHPDSGRAQLYRGSSTGLAATPTWTLDGEAAGAMLGASVSGGRDLDGDSLPDVLVGAPGANEGAGAVLALRGRMGRPESCPAARIDGAPGDCIGGSVLVMPDGNGDGLADAVVAGGDCDGGGRGRVRFHAGSTLETLSPSPLRIVERVRVDTWRQPHRRALRGAVDGLSLVAPFVQAPGLDPAGALRPVPPLAVGDLDGDGHGDVVVGEPTYDVRTFDWGEGRVLAWRGPFLADADGPAWIIESMLGYERYGSAVAISDVDGDGRDDIFAAARHHWGARRLYSGRVTLHRSSPVGVLAEPSWSTVGAVPGMQLGFSLAVLGDIDGDERSDLAFGAPCWPDPRRCAGAVSIHHPAPRGADRNVRAMQADGETPLAADAIVSREEGLLFRASGRTPFGRSRVQLEWQVANGPGGAFVPVLSGTSGEADTGAPGPAGSVVPLESATGPLPFLGAGRWRARLRTGMPFPWASPWRGTTFLSVGDSDSDGVPDTDDNAPAVANPGQEDADGDGVGDAADPHPDDPDDDADCDGTARGLDPCPEDALDDADGDGLCADIDNCPATANADQADADGDGTGDACDACPTDPNGDEDGDGLCNAEDPCPRDPDDDSDGDGVCGDVDVCPTTPDPSQVDSDGDGVGDACDPCPDSDIDDVDSDGLCGDVDPCPLGRDNDSDGDGLCAPEDNCPEVRNDWQEDRDGDGIGDACDPCPSLPGGDVDADGTCDAEDACPFDPLNDADGDGRCDDIDNCPETANPAQGDADWDDRGDACDPCPDVPTYNCIGVMREDGLSMRTFALHASLLGPPPLTRARLAQDVENVSEVVAAGDAVYRGPGVPGVIIFYETSSPSSLLRVMKRGGDVILTDGW